ncbi:MAG: polyketide synthase dehydratase domain-containing protein, partial [Acidobacteriota bacterium]
HRFRVDCFRAVLEWAPETLGAPTSVDGAMLPLDPEQLYDGVLFHTGRFRQVRGYRKLRATECLAVIEAEDRGSWFGSLHPSTLLLGDPGARDASIHAIQACIPHATVLPVAIERLELGPAVGTAGPRHVAAIERHRDGRTLVYDLDVVAADGVLAERWHGLTLQVVEEPRVLPLAPPLLGPYLERRLGDFAPTAELRVGMVYRNGHERPEGGRLALETALGHQAEIRHRPDGKPEVDAASELAVSIAHSDRLTLAVAGHGKIGCDLETVRGRDEDTWHRLLDPQWDLLDLLCREHGETLDLGATRLWAVVECLKKAGRRGDHPLTLKTITDDGWTLFGAGEQLAAAVLLTEPGVDEPVVAAVLADPRSVNGTSTLRS